MGAETERQATVCLYVYYRTARPSPEQTIRIIERILRRVERELFVRATLMLRQDDEADYLTWMEVFEPITPTLKPRLVEVLRSASLLEGLSPLMLGERHFEQFRPVQLDSDGRLTPTMPENGGPASHRAR